MPVTVEELERRVALLEQEVAGLRRTVEDRAGETPAESGERMRREARASQAALSAAWATALREMGLADEPVSVQELRESIIAGGVNPDDNLASREIMAMREE
jgi:hypothetical protein